jgi:hypothetical protein
MEVIKLSGQPLEQLRDWTEVDVYEDIEEIPKPYAEIALLEISSAVTKERMLLDSQHRAAELGGTGIVLEHAGTHTEMNMIFVGDVFIPVADERWNGRVLVIRVI